MQEGLGTLHLTVRRTGQGGEGQQEGFIRQGVRKCIELMVSGSVFTLLEVSLENPGLGDASNLCRSGSMIDNTGEQEASGIEMRVFHAKASQHEEASGLFGGRRGRRGKQKGLSGSGVTTKAEIVGGVEQGGLGQ